VQLTNQSLFHRAYPQFLQLQVGDASDLQVLARLSDCNVYTALNARNQFRAPTEFGLCLTGEREALRCLACESERTRTCWLTAMRLAKVSQSCFLHSLGSTDRWTEGVVSCRLCGWIGIWTEEKWIKVWVDGHMDGGRVDYSVGGWAYGRRKSGL
jgi:hypothetical protein